jgi:hypothetical protein
MRRATDLVFEVGYNTMGIAEPVLSHAEGLHPSYIFTNCPR